MLWRAAVARAQAVTAVHLSAQPPADRSVQQLRRRRRWTAPAACWAARPRSCPPSARQRAQTVAAPCLTSLPPGGAHGRHRRRCALAVPLVPVTPHPPHKGVLRSATAPEGTRLCRSCRFLGQLSAPPWASSQPGTSPATVHRTVRPASGPLWAFLPPCMASQCNARGLLRQGPASRRAPAGRPPWSGCQRGP
jgi:hypothetical protein